MITFNSNKENYMECRKIQIKREFLGRVLLELLGSIFVIIMTTVIIMANKNLTEWFYLLSLGVWIVFCIITNFKVKREYLEALQNKINLYEKQNMFGPSRIEILNEGICLEMNGNKRIYPWKLIRKIKAYKGNLYVFIGSIDYIAIPKEAFKNKDVIDFIKEIFEYKNGMKTKVTVEV